MPTFCFLFAFVCCEYQAPQLWPLPQSVTLSSSDVFYIPSSFQFQSSGAGEASGILQEAFSRCYENIFPQNPSSIPEAGLLELNTLDIRVDNLDSQFIQFGMDESYQLFINQTGSYLSAPTVFGAMHGLETFTQLVRFQKLPSVSIEDFPRFPWRGLLVDSSRHFQSVDTIKRAIRGISYDKMNVLHWHLSDGQSFPYQSHVHPNLTEGAYSPSMVYTQSEIAEIVAYANSFGIRVVVEFDMPSHAGPSWGKGYPFLTMNCSTLIEGCDNPLNFYTDACSDFPFDPTNAEVYSFLDSFIEEITSVFPDQYVHLGGDEVKRVCWGVPRILSWMKQQGMNNFDELEQYFLSKVQAMASRNNKNIVNWEEVFTSGFTLAPGTIIEVWKDSTTLDLVAQAGYGALLSYNWYLDHLSSTWQDFYNNEPESGQLTAQEMLRIYGGETCMWAEKVDASNFDAKVWPRNSAAAERLWSAKSTTNMESAEFRLAYHRCRLNGRSIAASPINSGPPCSLYYL